MIHIMLILLSKYDPIFNRTFTVKKCLLLTVSPPHLPHFHYLSLRISIIATAKPYHKIMLILLYILHVYHNTNTKTQWTLYLCIIPTHFPLPVCHYGWTYITISIRLSIYGPHSSNITIVLCAYWILISYEQLWSINKRYCPILVMKWEIC